MRSSSLITFLIATALCCVSLVIADSASITYTWSGLLASNIQIVITADIESDRYYAIAASSSGMASGTGVACKLQSTSNPTSPTCRAIATFNNGVNSRADSSLVVVSASITNNKAVITLSMAPSSFNVNSNGASLRFIWAKGTWDASTNLPAQHASSNRGAKTLSISSSGGVMFSTAETGGSSAGALYFGSAIVAMIFVVATFLF
jgi:hypothetical protein